MFLLLLLNLYKNYERKVKEPSNININPRDNK